MSRFDRSAPPAGVKHTDVFPAGFCQDFPDTSTDKHSSCKIEHHSPRTNVVWRKISVSKIDKHYCIDGHGSNSVCQVKLL